jgi:hypothetical protein
MTDEPLDQREDYLEAEGERNETLAYHVAEALKELPIMMQLKFMKEVMAQRYAAQRDYTTDPLPAIMCDVLENVMEVLEKHPRVAKKCRLDPEP